MQTTNIQYKNIDHFSVGCMFFICAVWGMQQVAIKAAAEDMSPMFQIALRSLIAAILVSCIAVFSGEIKQFKQGVWKSGSIAGCLFALEFLLVSEGLRFTSASHMVVFLYTAPIFSALGLQFFVPQEKLMPLQWIGVVIAFIGIAVSFFDVHALSGDTAYQVLIGDFLGLLAGATWGATIVVIRSSPLSQCPASQTLLFQLIAACILLFIVAVITHQTDFTMTPIVWISLSFQIVIVCVISFLLWFWLLRRYLASMLGILSFMTPFFGVVFGVVLLGEVLTLRFVIGSLFVIVGILIVTGYHMIERLIKHYRSS